MPVKKRVRNKVIRIVRSAVKKHLPRVCYRLFSLLPIKSGLAVFESYRGESFSGNPKYILLELKQMRGYKCVVFVNDPAIYKNDYTDVSFVRRFSLAYIYWLARAEYVVNNVNYPDFVRKRAGSFHVQTMHGTPLKLMGSDLIDIESYAYKQNLLGLYSRSKRWDLLVTPNAYTTAIFSRVFGFSGEVLECGYPRNDILVRSRDEESVRNTLRAKLGVSDKKILLFAPTWRETEKGGTSTTSLGIDFELLKQAISAEYVVFLRLHHLAIKEIDISDYSGFLFDYSDYPDSQELLAITDLLVTDYSSIMFDYMNLRRPIVLYTHDYDEYMKDRGSYFDIREALPDAIAETQEQLITKILDASSQVQDSELYDAMCRSENGTASKQVVERMMMK